MFFFYRIASRKEKNRSNLYFSVNFLFPSRKYDMNARGKVGLNLRLQRKIYVCVKGAKDVENFEKSEYENLE